MKLYIAMIASVIAISGCKKDEDSGAADDGGGATCEVATTCDGFLAAYGACDAVTADMAAAYATTLEAYTDAQCEAASEAWVAASCCDQY